MEKKELWVEGEQHLPLSNSDVLSMGLWGHLGYVYKSNPDTWKPLEDIPLHWEE